MNRLIKQMAINIDIKGDVGGCCLRGAKVDNLMRSNYNLTRNFEFGRLAQG